MGGISDFFAFITSLIAIIVICMEGGNGSGKIADITFGITFTGILVNHLSFVSADIAGSIVIICKSMLDRSLMRAYIANGITVVCICVPDESAGTADIAL